MNTIELISVQRSLEDYLKSVPAEKRDSRLKAALNTLTGYVKRVENPRKRTQETHRIARVSEPGNINVYITPVFDRLHSIEPTTGVSYVFSVDTEGNVLVTLTIDGRDWTQSDVLLERSYLHRSTQFLEDYIGSHKSPDGCLECGAGPKKICEPHCGVLEAEMLLNSIRRIA